MGMIRSVQTSTGGNQIKKNIDWVTLLFIAGYHLLLIVSLPLLCVFGTVSWKTWALSCGVVAPIGLSVTAGYHRLFSHTAYKTHPIVEFFLLFFGAMSTQGSAYTWAHDHRLHHAFADTEKDPYTVKDGFWHAHIFWLFKKKTLDPKVVSDLQRRRLVMNQHKYYGVWLVVSNILCITTIAMITGEVWAAIVVGFIFRMFVVHHSTWFINSLAHYWGTQTYSKEQTAVDNFVIAFLTMGEGYHNFHHTHARDYRNGVRWWHYDPTKWFIWTLNKIGLASNLQRTKWKDQQLKDVHCVIKPTISKPAEAL